MVQAMCVNDRLHSIAKHEFFLFQGFEFEVLHGGGIGHQWSTSGRRTVDGILIVLEHTDPPDSADFISLLIKARSADGLRQVL